MTTAQRIINAALRGAMGLIQVERNPNLCLKFARQSVEAGLKKPDGWFYSLMPNGAKRDAATAEITLKAKGWAVPINEAQPGDLAFNGNVSRPYGHVGVIVAPGVVLENTSSARGIRFGGAIAMTLLTQFNPTTIIRLPEEL